MPGGDLSWTLINSINHVTKSRFFLLLFTCSNTLYFQHSPHNKVYEALNHRNVQVKWVVNGSFNINCPLNFHKSRCKTRWNFFFLPDPPSTLQGRYSDVLGKKKLEKRKRVVFICVVLLAINETCPAPSIRPRLCSHWSEIRLISGWCPCTVMSYFTPRLRLLCAVSCPN